MKWLLRLDDLREDIQRLSKQLRKNGGNAANRGNRRDGLLRGRFGLNSGGNIVGLDNELMMIQRDRWETLEQQVCKNRLHVIRGDILRLMITEISAATPARMQPEQRVRHRKDIEV